MIVIVLSVVVVRKKEPPLSSTDIKGFRLRIISKNYKNTCDCKNDFSKKSKIFKTLELIPTRVECYNTISRPNDGIQELKKSLNFSVKSKFFSRVFLFKFS